MSKRKTLQKHVYFYLDDVDDVALLKKVQMIRNFSEWAKGILQKELEGTQQINHVPSINNKSTKSIKSTKNTIGTKSTAKKENTNMNDFFQ